MVKGRQSLTGKTTKMSGVPAVRASQENNNVYRLTDVILLCTHENTVWAFKRG